MSRAVSRGVKVKSVGCRMEVAKRDAIGFQDHPIHRHVAKYTMLQCQQRPDMAQYDSQSIQIGPAGCTQFNQSRAMVHDERPCTDPTVSEDGKMSKKKCFKDAVMMKAILYGLLWKIFMWQVEAAFPDIPTIVQRALNAISQMAEGMVKSETTVIRKQVPPPLKS